MEQRYGERVTDALGAKMREQRISQANAAKHLGISQTAVHRRFSGEVEWRLNELETLASLLGVAVEDLVGSQS